MTCGLRQAGVEVMAGVDLAEECESTYEANNPGTKFVGADITKLEENYFEKQFGLIESGRDFLFRGYMFPFPGFRISVRGFSGHK